MPNSYPTHNEVFRLYGKFVNRAMKFTTKTIKSSHDLRFFHIRNSINDYLNHVISNKNSKDNILR